MAGSATVCCPIDIFLFKARACVSPNQHYYRYVGVFASASYTNFFWLAHKNLIEWAGILHRDISINNIMMAPTEGTHPSTAVNSSSVQQEIVELMWGLLINFDYAMYLNGDHNTASPGDWMVCYLYKIYVISY